MAKLSSVCGKRAVPLEEAVELAGYGVFNILILLAAGGGLMCVIIETMSMMFVIPAAQCDLNLTLSTKSLLSSISFFGVVVSSYMWGYIADTKGRRFALLLSLSISAISSTICCIIPYNWLFIILRFINGFFIGGTSSVVYAYTGEFHSNYNRPKAISYMSTFVAFGNMYLPGIAWLILPEVWSFDLVFIQFRPWRLLLIVYALPSILVTILLCFLPETPKFLITQQRHDEALRVLQEMFAINNKKSIDQYPVSEIEWNVVDITISGKTITIWQSIWKQTAPLFKGHLLIKTLMMCFLQFGVFTANAGIMMWYPEILNRMSIYISETDDHNVGLCEALLEEKEIYENSTANLQPIITCKDEIKTDVFLVSLIVAIAYAFTFLLIGMIINLVGKKQLMVIFITITTTAGLLSQYVTGYTLIELLIGIFLMGGSGISLTNAIAVDLFPTQVRAMALAISLMFGRIGGCVGTNIVAPILYNLCDYLFPIVSINNLLLIIVVICLPKPSNLVDSTK